MSSNETPNSVDPSFDMLFEVEKNSVVKVELAIPTEVLTNEKWDEPLRAEMNCMIEDVRSAVKREASTGPEKYIECLCHECQAIDDREVALAALVEIATDPDVSPADRTHAAQSLLRETA